MSNEIKEDENENKIILIEEEKKEELKEEKKQEKKEEIIEVVIKEEKEEKEDKEEKINVEVINEEKKEEIKEDKNEDIKEIVINEEIIKEKNEEKKVSENDIKNINSEKPLYSDESKTIYKINNTPLIKEISVIKSKNNPPTRSYLSVEYSNKNNSIICIGGTDTSCEQYNKINEYNIKDNIWKEWNNDDQIEFGLELSGHSSNLVKFNKKEYIFIFGGYDNWKKEFTSQSYLINISNKIYEKINYNYNNTNNEKIIEFPLPRSYHTSNYDEEKQIIYIYGGTDMNINHGKNNNFQSLWAFYLQKRFWKKIELSNNNPQGAPRGHSSILFNDKLYIFGGVVLFKKFQNKLIIIDLNTKKIETFEFNNDGNNKNGIIPKPMAFHSAILIDNEKFLIHGGLDKNYNAINDCYIFYFKNLKFDKIIIPLIPNLFGHKIVMNSYKNKLYIIGGMDNFKHVGDENLIYKIDEDGENLFNKNEGQIEFQPMLNILEIVLNKEEEKIKENKDENSENKDNNHLNKRRRWKKLFYKSNN